MIRKFGLFTALLGAGLMPGMQAALAMDGQPEPWQMGFQPSATERMSQIIDLHTFVLYIITLIALFVLGLLVWIVMRFNANANPIPSETTHNTVLEVLWTVVPVAILVMIAVPSFRILYFQEVIPPADMTIKAIGKQWYWTYEYPDHGNFSFDSLMLSDRVAEQQNEPRLLGTNNHVVVPAGKTVRLLTTGADVIHAWTIPAFGVKIDANPGKINQAWFKAEREGKFYGECSELCGARHSFMPIEVEVVSQERFDQWVAEARTKFASAGAPTRLAAGR